MLLHEFLSLHLPAILASVRHKFLVGPDRAAFADKADGQVELFINRLIETLREDASHPEAGHREIRASAAEHGAQLLEQGFTVAHVIHGYGSICQAVTDLAVQLAAPITASEFRTLNQCLDAAIAGAVSEYSRQREQSASAQSTRQLGFLAHELRNRLSSALLAFEILEKGQVAIGGSTGGVLKRSLLGLRDLIDRAISEVRLQSDASRRDSVRVAEIVEEVEASAMLDAQARSVSLVVTPGAYDLFVDVDRHLITSALSNLVQNGIKFTPPGGTVGITAHAIGDRVLIDVADGCGGLPDGMADTLFQPYVQAHADRAGLGLGLTIARQSVEANGGQVRVEDRPDQGCTFTIELPTSPSAR